MGALGHIKVGKFKCKFLAVFAAIFAFSALFSTALAPNAFADDDDNHCYSEGGSVSWVACPVTQYIAEGQDGIYGVIKKMLIFDAGFFTGDGGASQAWAVFRNIANVILVIILLVIIFSQVTGIGIDNYGVKRALPRLIAISIIVNLSFIICQLAVDTSNVVGNSLSKLLTGLAKGITDAAGGNAASLYAASFVDVVLAVFAVGTAAVAASAPVLQAIVGSAGAGSIWVLLVPLIIGLLIALVAILIFFIMLAARQMIAIICVAISPIAIACYVLPNTQSLGRKWFSLLRTCLIIFPVCSALYGAGQLVKAITSVSLKDTADLNTVSFFMLMTSHIAAFLPYFAAPAMTKQALNAVGNVGAMLDRVSGGMKNAGRKASNAWQDSGRYKQAQSRAKVGFNNARINGRPMSENKRMRLQNRINSLNSRQANGETLSRRENRRLNSAQNALSKEGSRGLAGKKQRRLDANAANARLAELDSIVAGGGTLTSSQEKEQKRLRKAQENNKLFDAARLAELDGIVASGGVLSDSQLKEQKQLRKAQGKLDSVNNNIGRLRMANLSETKNQKKIDSYADANKEAAAISNMENQLEEERIGDQMSLIASGDYTYGNNQKTNVDSLDSLEAALAYEAGEGGNVEKAMALMRTLESKGDDGMDRVSRVLNSGAATNGNVRKRMARAVANSGKYKTGTRSTHVAAQNMLNNPDDYKAGMVDEVREGGGVLNKYKADNIPDMTDAEFDGFVDGYAGTQYASQAASLMNAALSDDRVRNRLKSGQISRMENAIQAAGITPATQNGIPVGPAPSGETTYVDHSNPAPASPGTTTVNVSESGAPAQDQIVNATVHNTGSAAPQVSNIDVQREAELAALRNPELTADQVRSVFNQSPAATAGSGPVQVNETAGTNTASGTINRTTNTHTDTTADEVVNQNVNLHETNTTDRQVQQTASNQHTETINQGAPGTQTTTNDPVQVNEIAGNNTNSGAVNRTTNTHTDTTTEEVVNQNVNRHETNTTNRQVEQTVNNQHTETINQNVNTQTSSTTSVSGNSEAAVNDATRTAVNNTAQANTRRNQMTGAEAANHLDDLARRRDANNRNNSGPGGIILPH